jgi:hypothetical protein
MNNLEREQLEDNPWFYVFLILAVGGVSLLLVSGLLAFVVCK